MSKRDNKRFNDKDRKSAPKRGGKNRRDYGDSYEPRSRAAEPGSKESFKRKGRRQGQPQGARL